MKSMAVTVACEVQGQKDFLWPIRLRTRPFWGMHIPWYRSSCSLVSAQVVARKAPVGCGSTCTGCKQRPVVVKHMQEGRRCLVLMQSVCAASRYELWRLGDLRLVTRAHMRAALPHAPESGTPGTGLEVGNTWLRTWAAECLALVTVVAHKTPGADRFHMIGK